MSRPQPLLPVPRPSLFRVPHGHANVSIRTSGTCTNGRVVRIDRAHTHGRPAATQGGHAAMLRCKQRDLGIGTSHRAFASERLLMTITAFARVRVRACVHARAQDYAVYSRGLPLHVQQHPYWSLRKTANHCGIHSVISSGFATCRTSCDLHAARRVLIPEWMPQ